MPRKKINVIVAESGAEHEIELPFSNLEQCRAAITKEIKRQSYLIIDESGIPILNNQLLSACNATTFYIIEKEPNVDAKIVDPKAALQFHKASVKFLIYVIKDATAFYESLCNRTSESSNRINEAIKQRSKSLEAIAELKLFGSLFLEDVSQLKKNNDAALKAIENHYNIEVSRILSDFKRGISDYANKKESESDIRQMSICFNSLVSQYDALKEKLECMSKEITTYEREVTKPLCLPMQFLSNYKGISSELKKRYVFNEVLSNIIMKLKLICEKENNRREDTSKIYEQSLPLPVHEEMLKMCPNILCMPSKPEVRYVNHVEPNEFKFIANQHFPFFFKLANIDMSEEIEEYKTRLGNSCIQINEMTKKIDDLQKQLAAKPLQIEKQADIKELAAISRFAYLEAQALKNLECFTLLKELVANMAAKTIGKAYFPDSYMDALKDMHSSYCKMSKDLKSAIRDLIEIKKVLGTDKVCRVKYGGKISEGDWAIFSRGLHGSLIGVIESSQIYISHQNIEGHIILAQISKLQNLSDKVVNTALANIKELK